MNAPHVVGLWLFTWLGAVGGTRAILYFGAAGTPASPEESSPPPPDSYAMG
jgi:hypothetical protein